jgi:general secretion pathway protein D
MQRSRTYCWISLCSLALTTAACQTIEDSSLSNSLRPAQFARADAGPSWARGTTGAPLLADRPIGSPTFLEGTGRFVGAPSPSTQQAAADTSGEGVRPNLVNVPAPQAAKTVFGDILGVKYAVDLGIEGKVTIQAPEPVTRIRAVDLFQTALRANNAAIVNTVGTFRIVPLDQAAVGASMRVERPADLGERIGSGRQIVQIKYATASECAGRDAPG